MKILRYSAIALLVLPLVATAQSASVSSASSLLSEITALEQQINALTTASSSLSVSTAPTTPSPSPTITTNLCPDLSRTLSLGASGADVGGLQEFLASQGIFHAVVTGYFGTVTQAAVETWQADNGIVSYGSPETTGYGVVGPRTQAAMESLCEGGQSGATNQSSQAQGSSSTSIKPQCMQTLPPSTECPTSWQPVLDSNGCTEYYQCAISLPNATNSATQNSSPAPTSSCPVAQVPTCSGTVESFKTSNGCAAYECVIGGSN